ncbi:MAG TPA: Non-canonical purine NTP pyrophosphatase, partial [Gammaproteobacteria bacterium]|nr:Non-canonical purine NTP pyrophosphatase [Gammaproteobacteria bacterium]
MKIILATRNKGKLKEFNILAKGTDLEFIPLPDEIGDLPEETGT